MTGDLQQRMTRAVAWVGIASATVAVFDAITLAILLWQWVTPTDLGVATLAVTLFYFIDLVTEAGLTSVLIQRETLDDDTVSTVFWLNVGVSLVAFLAVLGIGPVIGAIQDQPIVGWMLIAYGTKLVFQNVYFVPAALLRREMRFKELSIVRTIANAGDVTAKLAVAAAGEPIWCFVAGPLARVAITGIGVQICRPWRPRRTFDRREARAMLSFGFTTTGTQYLQHFYTNITYQIVGFYFGEAMLGIYRVAYELALYPVNWISNVVSQVAFPAFARLRSDRRELAAQFVRFSRQNLATVLPILVLVAVGAGELLALLFPEVGAGATAARLLCVVGLLRGIDCLYIPLLDGMGLARSNARVAVFATIVLVGLDLAFAAYVGPELGYLAVVVGRLVGYPLVIAMHARIALLRLELPLGAYLRPLVRLVAWAAIAACAGIVVGLAVPPLTPATRLLAIGGVSIAILGLLLHRVEHLGPAAVVRAFRTKA